jgi:hypothetical protein
MENKESGASEVLRPTPKEINRARRKFSRVVRGLPSESRDFITEMTSILTEPDIYRSFREHPGNVESFERELRDMGLGENKIRVIFTFFNLPYQKEEDGK